ncbi:MAG: hypothetical protein SZ59_C0002G0264 [candidate division TM6 bacterium GW2011_GWF2_28_16]|nr:MAG: hypothetical protein SZ59_C0002G0264 [candidate division TM6 bacterium GW2011_GWF2_28_16]
MFIKNKFIFLVLLSACTLGNSIVLSKARSKRTKQPRISKTEKLPKKKRLAPIKTTQTQILEKVFKDQDDIELSENLEFSNTNNFKTSFYEELDLFKQNILNTFSEKNRNFIDQSNSENLEHCLYYGKRIFITDNTKVYSCGDLHGSVFHLIKNLLYLKSIGAINENLEIIGNNLIVFTGDFVDRGAFGVEVLYLLMVLYNKNPDKVVIIKGNHEDINLTINYGFALECYKKLLPKEPNTKDNLYKNFELYQEGDSFIDMPDKETFIKSIFELLGSIMEINKNLEAKQKFTKKQLIFMKATYAKYQEEFKNLKEYVDIINVLKMLTSTSFIIFETQNENTPNLIAQYTHGAVDIEFTPNLKDRKETFPLSDKGSMILANNNIYNWADMQLDKNQNVASRGQNISAPISGENVFEYANKNNIKFICAGHDHQDKNFNKYGYACYKNQENINDDTLIVKHVQYFGINTGFTPSMVKLEVIDNKFVTECVHE